MTPKKKAYMKEYRKRNKSKIQAQEKAYREKHKEHLKQWEKEYLEKNKVEIYAKHKIYRDKNKEKIYKKKREYSLSERGVLKVMHKNMIRRFEDENIPYVDTICSFEDFLKFIETSTFKEIYDNWVASGYETKLKPSIDRIDCNQGYGTFNLQILTKSENCKKGHLERDYNRIPILAQKGEIKLVFRSRADASRFAHVSYETMKKRCADKKSINGFTFEEYKGD